MTSHGTHHKIPTPSVASKSERVVTPAMSPWLSALSIPACILLWEPPHPAVLPAWRALPPNLDHRGSLSLRRSSDFISFEGPSFPNHPVNAMTPADTCISSRCLSPQCSYFLNASCSLTGVLVYPLSPLLDVQDPPETDVSGTDVYPRPRKGSDPMQSHSEYLLNKWKMKQVEEREKGREGLWPKQSTYQQRWIQLSLANIY